MASLENRVSSMLSLHENVYPHVFPKWCLGTSEAFLSRTILEARQSPLHSKLFSCSIHTKLELTLACLFITKSCRIT